MGVSAIEHRHVRIGRSLTAEGHNLIGHELCFIVGGITGEADDVFALADFREQVLGFPVEVVSNDRIGYVQNVLGGAVVLLEQNCFRPLEITLELGDVANIGTAEGINRLVRVAHHGERGARDRAIGGGRNLGVSRDQGSWHIPGELSNQGVLGVVRVLVLINQHMAEPGLISRRHLGKGPKEIDGLANQVVKVKGLGFSELPLIPVPHLDEERICWIIRPRNAAIAINIGQLVLEPGHLANHSTVSEP